MPVFEFTQKEVITHSIVVRADSKAEAEDYIDSLGDDGFADSDSDWENTKCKKVSDDSFVDEDLTDDEYC